MEETENLPLGDRLKRMSSKSQESSRQQPSRSGASSPTLSEPAQPHFKLQPSVTSARREIQAAPAAQQPELAQSRPAKAASSKGAVPQSKSSKDIALQRQSSKGTGPPQSKSSKGTVLQSQSSKSTTPQAAATELAPSAVSVALPKRQLTIQRPRRWLKS